MTEINSLPNRNRAQGACLPIASIGMLGFAVLVIWRPLAASQNTHNALVLAFLLAGCTALAIAAFGVSDGASWTVFSIHVVLLGFLIRALPVLMFRYPPNHDPYYYFVSALNVIDGHRITPILQDWYAGVGQQLQWPILQLLTAQVHLWTGIPATELWRFFLPALGSLTYLAVGLVARTISQSWPVASVAGLLASFADLVVFYQSEYHPQGLAILSGILLIYMVLISRRTSGVGIRLLLIAVGAFFLFSHHGSALLVPFIMLPLLALPVVGRVIGSRWHLPAICNTRILRDGLLLAQVRDLSRFSSIIVLLSVAALAMNVHLSDAIFVLAVRSIDPSLALLPAAGDLAWWIAALRAVKYALLLFAILGVVVALRRPSADRLVLVVMLVGATAAGLPAALVAPAGATRLLALWLPWAGLFAAIALVWLAGARGRLRPAVATAGLTSFLVAGLLNSQIPAYFLEGTPRSRSMFYGNELPDPGAVAVVGEWLRANTPPYSVYAVDFSTRMAPFYFAKRPDNQLIFGASDADRYCRSDFLVLDRAMPQGGVPAGIPLEHQLPKLYDDGRILVFDNRGSRACP